MTFLFEVITKKEFYIMNVTPKANIIRILKNETCPALLGKSILTYHIACNSEPEVLLMIANNTNRGIFNKEWIKLNSIFEVLDKHPSDKAIESSLLAHLFQGTSTNSSGFLLAVLRNEGLVSRVLSKPHYFERMNPEKLLAEIDKLIQSGVNLKVYFSSILQE